MRRRAASADSGASIPPRHCPTLGSMSPDQPGAPAPSKTGGTATFRPGVEQAVPEPAKPEPASRARTTPPPARRRLLDDPDPTVPKGPRRAKVRARKVRRIVRHIEPWSVLKISVLFFLSIFLIICVASALLWNTARSAGAIDDVEDFITDLGFGNCEALESETTTPDTTPSTIDGAGEQVSGGAVTSSTVAPVVEEPSSTLPDEDGDCPEGQVLVGGFKFEDQQIFRAFALGGAVLVLAGAAGSVVLVLLFNLMSDLTGGVRLTVLEEEPTRPRTGSPPPAGRD